MVSNWFFHVMINNFFIVSGIKKRGQEEMMQGESCNRFCSARRSTSINRAGFNGRFHCKMVGGELIEGDNNGIILGGVVGL